MSSLLPPDLTDVLDESRALGFLGPGDLQRHIDHGVAMAGAVPTAPQRFLDLGAGGGVPGLVEAYVWPDASGVLLEAQVRRAEFLRESINRLGLEGRVEVLEGRAELSARQAPWRGRFDVVTARSFGPPAVTAECAAGFLSLGGRLIVSEPPDAVDSAMTRWPADDLNRLGLSGATTLEVDGFSFVVIEQMSAADDRWPRRVGIPSKRPLWQT